LTGGEHRYRGVVGVHLPCGEDVTLEFIDQGAQQRVTLPNPFGQRRTGKIDSLAGVDITLPIQGKVIRIPNDGRIPCAAAW
jgi:hypothetical protein